MAHFGWERYSGVFDGEVYYPL
ncbi:hypothetical protein A2U01_0008566, partial [Trifolium medium]|nr:hypothetical protein [Trifolium medium]